MRIIFHKKFDKQYAKLPDAQKKRFENAIVLFRSDPYHHDLYNHPLGGQWKDHRSISFGGDWRAHYIIINKDEVLFVAIGTHSQLYK